MGRQEQPLDLDQGPVARFAYELRELRRRAGSPPYRQLAARAHYSASTLAAAAAGRRLPSAAVLAAFVTACGGDPADWEQRRVRTHRLITSPPPLPPEAPPGGGTPGYPAALGNEPPDPAQSYARGAAPPTAKGSFGTGDVGTGPVGTGPVGGGPVGGGDFGGGDFAAGDAATDGVRTAAVGEGAATSGGPDEPGGASFVGEPSGGAAHRAGDLAALARLPASRSSVAFTPSRTTPPEEKISVPVRSTVSAPGDPAGEPHSASPDPVPAPGATPVPESVTPPPSRSGRSSWPDRLVSGRLRASRLRTAGLAALIVLAAVLLTAGVFHLGDRGVSQADAGPEGAGKPARTTTPAVFRDGAHLLRTDAGIPRAYRHLIIEAGTLCDTAEITPALVAAILKAESDFDPTLSDPAKDEYGIARWTPRVLRYYLPPERQNAVPRPPFSPEDSIAALGRMLCAIAPDLVGVPGDPALHLAAAYRTATWVVQQQGAQLRSIQPYLSRVRTHLENYRPQVRK